MQSSHDRVAGHREVDEALTATGPDATSTHAPNTPTLSDTNGTSHDAAEQIEPGLVPVESSSTNSRSEARAEKKSGPLSAKPRSLHVFARHLAVLGLLMNASIWGTLAREGLIALNTYDGRSIQPVIWAQALGCLVMGWTVANKETLEAWYPPLFIALGTGFCGSVTTFSTWALQVFQAYSNQLHYQRHGLHNVMDALTQTAATLGMSLISLQAGRALAEVIPASMLERLRRRRQNVHGEITTVDGTMLAQSKPGRSGPAGSHPVRPTPQPERIFLLDIFCFIVLGLGFWIGAALLSAFQVHPNFRPTTFAIVFAPPGAILRWYLSRWNTTGRSKSRFPFWPLGTLVANELATLVLAGLFVAQHIGTDASPPGSGGGASSIVSCQVLYGLQEGFCGCLSTISTFAVELSNLRPRRRAFGYAFGSYAIAMATCVIVIGAPWWSGSGMEGSCSKVITYRH